MIGSCMLEFRKLTLEDIPLIKPYFEYSESRACDDTVGGTFMWRDLFSTEYAILNDTVIFKAVDLDGSPAFSYPLGKGADDILNKMSEYCKEKQIPCKLIFINDIHLERLKTIYKLHIAEQRDWWDYLYNISDLATFSGRKYNGQRNHKNAFLKLNENARYVPLTKENVSCAIEFYKSCELYSRQGDRVFEEEKLKTAEVLEAFDTYGMEGGILYGNEGVCAFSLGEVKGDTLHVHVEKADGKKRGAYQTVVSEFAADMLLRYGDALKYVNRQEDQGVEGLRTSKLSYHPCDMVKKYTVIIE